MELRQLQQQFYQAVFEKDKSQEFSQQHFNSSDGLGVYRNSIFGGLTRSLELIYPVCHRVVGEQFFTATARVYIQHYPSASPDLGEYGQAFPEFLSQFEPVAQLPYLPDLARLEWHWHRVFNGEPTPTLDYQQLGKIPPAQWGEIIFEIPKNSILLKSIYPIHRIWQVNQPEYSGDETIHLDEGESYIFLWRDHYQMRIDLPTLTEWQLLQAFQEKNQLNIICEKLATVEPSINVATLLPLFVQRGWIVDFSV
jgi:hypothetical protein